MNESQLSVLLRQLRVLSFILKNNTIYAVRTYSRAVTEQVGTLNRQNPQ